jgi:hypothetical protein
MKTTTPQFLIVVLIACLVSQRNAHAVSPPPDGCYPNFNTAEGCNALNFLTTGSGNSGLGWRALFTDSTGNFNTGVGVGALVLNNADSNTAVGAAALLLNTIGSDNTAVGTDAMVFNTVASENNAFGAFALLNNDSSGLGLANFNNAHGGNALQANVDGSGNNAFGDEAMFSNTTGSFNTAFGDDALDACTTGFSNVAVGDEAGTDVVTGDHIICIGAGVAGADVSNTTWIGNVYGVTPQSGTTLPVIVSVTGQLGTVVSSERFKKDIATMNRASEAILSLRPVTFHYKTDATGAPQFGLIAEEVAKVNPALVLPDKEGKPYTVRYEAVNAMLLNEFLKEHRRNEEQQASITRLQNQVEVLTAGLQKVSAQLELNKSAPQTVLNSQ